LKIYQKPGKFNSLGRIKFVVPNTDGIFLHGSPYKSLFDKEIREFSSGCVRLQKTIELADLILDDVSATVLQTRMKDGRTRNYHVKNPMKFFIVDWPVTVDAAAKKVVFK
jgi:murein L,D-transpeptidase YcbB/YkuD